MTKERILEIVDQISSHYKFMEKVDYEVRTCGYGATYIPEWHIYNRYDFDAICKTLDVEPGYRDGKKCYVEIVVNNVHILYFDSEAMHADE